MTYRPLIQVAGPPGAGKTLFVEHVLRSFAGMILAARCVRDESCTDLRETSPRGHAELRRYRLAGAGGAALFNFPTNTIDSEDLYSTELMENYSLAVVLEGDCGRVPVELCVHVVPAPAAGASLLVRRSHDRAAEERTQVDAMERMLAEPDGVTRVLSAVVGEPAMRLLGERSDRLEAIRKDLLDLIERARHATPAKPNQRWGVAAGYEGIELAHVVIVNIRHEDERPRAERLIAEVARIRKDPQILDEILGWRGKRIPITAVVANLADAKETGTRKAIARIRRGIRRAREVSGPSR